MNEENKLITAIGIPIKRETVEIDGYHINYVTAGSGRPLLLIHAMTIGWGEWYSNIKDLSKNFRVYAIDLVGSGNSTKVDFTRTDFEKDFLIIVEKFIQIKKLKKSAIIGHSFGGLVALKIGQRKNVDIDKIIAIGPMGFTDKIPFTYKIVSINIFAKLLSSTVMKPTRKNMYNFLVSVMQNKNIKEEFVDYFVSVTADGLSHPLLFIHSFLHKFKLKNELLLKSDKQILNKTLLIAGDKDPTIEPFDISYVKIIIPNVKIEIFPNIGHVPPIEDSKKFNKMVIQFIDT